MGKKLKPRLKRNIRKQLPNSFDDTQALHFSRPDTSAAYLTLSNI